MKSYSVLLVFILAAFSAVAQTDTNAIVVPADTNAPAAPADTNAIVVPADTNAPASQPETNAVAVQIDTNTVVAPTNTVAAPMDATTAAAPAGKIAAMRQMSLEDCFREALQHNLDMQIERTAPQISLYNLRSEYAGYDPTFFISGVHGYNTDLVSTNGFNSITTTSTNFVLFPRTSIKKDTFNSTLGGLLPWGLEYNFVANLQQNYGTTYSGTTNLNSTLSKVTDGSAEVDLTQHLLKDFWIDTTRLNIRLAKNQFKSSEQGLRLQIINSITDVEKAYYELIFAQDNVKVQQEALTIAQTQLDQDRQRVQIGTMAQLDVQQDEAQVATSKANLIVAEYTLATAQNTLKSLLTDQYSRWYNSDIQPTAALTAPLQLFDLQDSWSKGMTQRPDLVQSRLAVEAQGITLKFDYNQLFPSLDLVGSYGYAGVSRDYDNTVDDIGRGARPYYTYGAQLSLPLSNVGARNNLKSGKVTLQQLLLKLKQFEQNIMVQIDNAVQQSRSAYEAVGATRQARIYAEAALDAEQKKYAVGKSTTFTVLQLQDNLTVARSREIRALADYNEALANLAQAEGSTLDRHHINLEVK